MSKIEKGKSIVHSNHKMEPVSRRTLADKDLDQDDDIQYEYNENNKKMSEDARSKIKQLFKESRKENNYMDAFSCRCGPDFYNAVLGPTADEAILKGLGMIRGMLQKFATCEIEEEEIEDAYVERYSEDVQSKLSSMKSVHEVFSSVIETMNVPPEVVSAIVQTSLEELEKKSPSLASKMLQTSTPEMVSKILQTLGFEPELADGIVQTSVESIVPPPSMHSAVMQTSSLELKNQMMQTSGPNVISAPVQTSTVEVASLPESSIITVPVKEKEPSVKEPSIKSPPKSIEKPKMCVCCKCCVPEDESINTTTSELSEKLKRQKMCICCKCFVPEEECADDSIDTRSYNVSERIQASERMIRAESQVKMRICKCLEYSTVPTRQRHTTRQRHRHCLELIDDTPVTHKTVYCSCKGSKQTYNAKGDTGCLADASCCCNSRKYRY